MNKKKIERATRWRERGWTYQRIADKFGVAHQTVQRWLTPKSYERNLFTTRRRRRQNLKEQNVVWARHKLGDAKRKAKKGGYAPPKIKPEEVVTLYAAHDDTCDCCGAAVSGGQGCFHLDHSHDTGEVRGLICAGCNVRLGIYEKYGEVLQKYLEK